MVPRGATALRPRRRRKFRRVALAAGCVLAAAALAAAPRGRRLARYSIK